MRDSLRPSNGLGLTYIPTALIPIDPLAVDAYRSTAVAKHQLARDVASLEARNDTIVRSNERAARILAPTTGPGFGDGLKG